MGLFFRKRVSGAAVKAHLERISFLMKYLEQYGMWNKKEVVEVLNKELLLAIPKDIQDPEGRVWPDPSNSNIAISFSCNNSDNINCVNQFTLIGFDVIANTLVIGTAHQKDKERAHFSWSITKESDARSVPPLSEKIHQEFWNLPGYNQIELGEFRFLKRTQV